MRGGVWVRAMFERRGMLSEFGRGDRVMVATAGLAVSPHDRVEIGSPI